MVFCGIYPADGADYENLHEALDKLLLNDASLSYDPETSLACLLYTSTSLAACAHQRSVCGVFGKRGLPGAPLSGCAGEMAAPGHG